MQLGDYFLKGNAMVQGIATRNNIPVDSLLRDCAATLEKVASYKLPQPMDRRLLWLSENKESLSASERKELLALIEFSEDRTVEKLQAKVILQRLAEAWPQLFGSSP
jgi:hypothetical protein